MDWKYTKENPLRVFEAFAGYGSQALALKYIGIPYKVVGIAEIDPAAIKGYMSIHGETKNYGAECISSFGTPEDMEQMLLDLTPIRVRIRKLTPTECLRLMDVRDDDIEKMKGSGLSNSALYKLAGNSIVCACLEGIFTQLFKQDQDTLF